MADVPFVYEGEGLQEFGKDEPEGLFLEGLEFAEVGVGEVLHDQIGEPLAQVEVESVVFDDGLVPQLLDAQEVALQLEDVLLVHRDDLYRVQLL